MIYTVMTYNDMPYRGRTVGYFLSYLSAYEAIVYNDFDMAENGYYKYAIIEAVKEGLYTMGSDSWWFIYDRETKTYVQIEKPPKYASTYNFSIG